MLIVGMVIGFFVGTSNVLKTIKNPFGVPTIPTPTQLPVPSSTLNPIESWKTYTNKTYAYSFQCPTDIIQRTTQMSISDGVVYPLNEEVCIDAQNKITFSVWKKTNDASFSLEAKTKELSGASLKPIDYQATVLNQYTMITYKEQNASNQIERSVALIILADKYIRVEGFSQDFFNQVLSTFKFFGATNTTPKPTLSLIPSTWKAHQFPQYGITLFTPDNWQSNSEDFPQESSSLIRFWQGVKPDTATIQLAIHTSWANTGDAAYQTKNYTVAGTIAAVKVDPPQKETTPLDRYQTNVYFEHDSHVYIFTCVHNWIPEQYKLCDTMLQSLQFK
jgi:hypothetical protein